MTEPIIMTEEKDGINERAEQLLSSQIILMQELVTLRKLHGLSQELVGERMGISQSAVEHFEGHESNPTLGSIRRYALAVGASIQYIIRDDLIA